MGEMGCYRWHQSDSLREKEGPEGWTWEGLRGDLALGEIDFDSGGWREERAERKTANTQVQVAPSRSDIPA